jgi:anti-sigma B factor antagonist
MLVSNWPPRTLPHTVVVRITVASVSTEGYDAQFRDEIPFACTVHRSGGTSEIALAGELDLATRSTLDEATATALHPGPVETLVIDFTGVTFADSTTVTWLLRTDRRVQAGGGRLVAVAAPGPVRELLRMTGVDEYLTVVAHARMR